MSGHLRGLQHGESLEKYIDRVIRPPSDFVEAMKNAVDQLVRYLHQLPNYSVKEIVQSGSLGKGTTVEQTADADLVVFFNGYRNMESLVENKPKILRDIDQYMRDPNPWKVIRRTGFHHEYEIGVPYKGEDHLVHVDILPAMDIIALHRGNMTSVYDEMERKPEDIQAHYSACFCKAQKELLRPKPAKVKDLIRLLKHWKNNNSVPMKSYCCEVLALYVFKEELGSNTSFDMKTGFKCALNLLRNFDGITLTITGFYDVAKWSESFPKDALIMDPVNPFSDLPFGDISRIKSIAESTMYALDNVPKDERFRMSGHLRGLQHGESLEKFIDRVIRPPSEVVERMKNAVDQLVRYLHKLPNYSIKEIVLSGSLGKGTTVEQTADVDLVVFFNGYSNMESLVENKPNILRDIEQYMRNPNPSFWRRLWPSPPSWMNSIKLKEGNNFNHKYEIGVPYKGVNYPVLVDILPAMDIIALRGSMANVYDEMKTKQEEENIQAHYSTCFCKAQKELLRPTPAKLKDLIRLLKHWKNYKNVPMKSYCCEVLALYVFKKELGSNSRFDMKTGFKRALNLLRNFDDKSESFPKDAFIMDPVNPFSDLPFWDISRIKSNAESTMYALDNVPEDKPGGSWAMVGIGVALAAGLLLRSIE